MKEQTLIDRKKNLLLIIIFQVFIFISLVVALFLAYSLTKKYVENEFTSEKVDVQEKTVKPYAEFFQNKIPEISFYQGFLDSASVVKYVDTILTKYAFINKVVFFDTQISNHQIDDGFKLYYFHIGPKAVYQFSRGIQHDSITLYKSTWPNPLSLKVSDEFTKMAVKFSAFVESSDTTRALTTDDQLNTFYNIRPNVITFMSIPRREELSIFKELMFKKLSRSLLYEQDILSFQLTPFKLPIKNTHPELYQKIEIKPLVFEPVDTDPDNISTDIPLPGAFSEYKLYFSSSRSYINREIKNRFFPIACGLLFIYSVLVAVAYLIYRNLNINSRMFKLQYDFINNLTHEFKTPVSVIKIAGNNIRSTTKLSDKERMHYGKILDEEADKLNDLMNRLLSFTQIENKSIHTKIETINLEIFTQNVIDAYQLKYPNFNIEYQVKGDTLFKTDATLLGSLFYNMIDNAYKYSKADSRQLNISIKSDKKHVVFKFKDNGIGIAKEELNNIFKKFYRIQSEYNQKGSVGIGLAFCKELVNFMHGEISVKSTPGRGSEFTIILPHEI
ncbi:MAG: histidine kinase [Sphingobacteriaceae bacterium]|jgi:two-component system phosphate regulon sensor histidine kinase PhoR|nr:histidine kinase [Sphingobacteriaceae bacterium]